MRTYWFNKNELSKSVLIYVFKYFLRKKAKSMIKEYRCWHHVTKRDYSIKIFTKSWRKYNKVKGSV